MMIAPRIDAASAKAKLDADAAVALDAGRRQHSRVIQQPIEPFLMGTIAVAFGIYCHP